jgi:hypothetical protein
MMVLTTITVLEDGQIVRTTSLQIDYFHPVITGSLTVEGREADATELIGTASQYSRPDT